MDAWIPFLLFSMAMAVTPGPTNILVFAISSRHGWVAALPVILGASATVATMLLLAGLGLGALLIHQPRVQAVLSWIGIAWLSWLAWKIFTRPPQPADASENGTERAYLGVAGAIGLQLANPKAWFMALSAVSVFASVTSGRTERVAEMALLFFLVSMPCVGVWAALGTGTGRFCRSPVRIKYLNRGLALLLLMSAWLSLLV